MITNEKIIDYVESLTPARSEIIQEMEEYARMNHVPIMELVSIETVIQLLRLTNPTNILEIGTAIGYSAIRIAKALPNAKIVTIEREESRYKLACAYIEKMNLQSQITYLYGDALELSEKVASFTPFDVLFMDAAKGQNQRFFELYEPLTKQGMIITDNVLFKGLVAEDRIEKRHIRALVRKIKQYNEWLMNHPNYHTTIMPIGDGIAVSKKR